MIILSLLGTTIGFLFSGLAQDYIQLLLSRIFNGCASCTRPVVAACVADVVPEEKVPKFMSIMGSFIGFSYLFGPVMGGVLAEFGGMRCPFYAATAVSAVGFVLSLIFVRETNPIVLEKRFKSKAKDSKPSDIDKPSQSEGKVEAIDPVQSSADGQTEIAKESDRIPIEVWILCALYFSACMGWTLYIAVFYLFMIETYAFGMFIVDYQTLIFIECIASLIRYIGDQLHCGRSDRNVHFQCNHFIQRSLIPSGSV